MNKSSLFKFLLHNFMGALLLASLFQTFVSSAHAQGNDPVTITATVGFDGYCKENTWLPIHVEVQNTGADLEATVTVAYKNNNNGITSTSMSVALPTTSRKDFFLYIYPQSFMQDLHVSLLNGNKTLKRLKLSANCVTAENLLFGVLTDFPSTYDVLNDVKPLTGFARVAQLRTADLPAKPQAWSALDGLVISNMDTGTLTADQQSALKAWLASGGRLLVIGGLKWQATAAGLKDILPIDLHGTQNVGSLNALSAWMQDQTPLETGATISVGTIRTGAEVLVKQDGFPILIQKSLGFGSVSYLAADPALQPLSDWKNIADLYTQLLGTHPPLPSWSNGFWTGYSSNQALGAISELGLPSILYISCLMGLYVLIIGPLNYFVLRRFKRRELAWITIPGLVLIFSFFAYGSGLLYRGSTPILNRLVVAQGWDGVDQAHAQALIGIYSPVRARYDLDATDQFLPQRFNGNNGDAQLNNDWTTTQDGTNTTLPDVRVEIGGVKAVVLDGTMPALPISHNLTLSISKLNPSISGSVTNNSQYTLKDVVLVTPSNYQTLGDLAPGKSKSVSVSVAPGNNAFYSTDPMTILGLNYTDIQKDVDAARRYSILQTVLAPNYQRNSGNWGVYLMGWVDRPLLPVELKNKHAKTVDTMLYIHNIQPLVKTEGSTLTLPASLFVWESSNPTVTPYYGQNPSGGYVLRFKPAVPVAFHKVLSLDLSLNSNANPTDLSASAWNYALKDWVPFPKTSVIPDADQFVGPNGEVKIKVTTNTSGYIEITSSYITLVVQP